jgi:hypothetical protein
MIMCPSSCSLSEKRSVVPKNKKIEISKLFVFSRHWVVRLSLLVYVDRHEAHDDRTRTATTPKPIVYGAAWGAWIKRNFERDLRSGARC